MPDTKKLRLAAGQSASFPANVPYLATVITKVGEVATSTVEAVSLDELGDVITTPENPNFLYDSNGELLFDTDKILLEVAS